MDNDKIFNLDDEQIVPVRGSLLVAKPTVNDPFFRRSVVLMVDHDRQGSMGLMISNYQGWTLKHQLADIDCERGIPVFLGGPVGMEQLFYLHTLGPDVIPDCLSLGGGLYIGGDFEPMQAYLQHRRPEDGIDGCIKFCLGYSGWEAGQLQQEIDRHDWAVIDTLPLEVILNDRWDDIWPAAVAQFGDRYRLWLNWPLDPSLN